MAKLYKELKQENQKLKSLNILWVLIILLLIAVLIVTFIQYGRDLKQFNQLNSTLEQQLNNSYTNGYNEGYLNGISQWNKAVYDSVYGFNQIPYIDNEGEIRIINIEGFCQ